MQGLRIKERNILIERFGFGTRLAVRVIALLSVRIDITETVLEAAAAETALEKTLLDRAILNAERPLDGALLQETARRHGYGDSELLRVADGDDGWRTIAFQDDIMAAAQEKETGRPENEYSLTRLDAAQQISHPESEEIFSPRDIAGLKMEALTGQDPQKRIEAIRKLVFTPETGTGKAMIFVDVINDETAGSNVRREAVRALENIGLDSELAEPLVRIFDDDPDVSIAAIQRIAHVMAGIEDNQAGVVLAVLLDFLARVENPSASARLMAIIVEKRRILYGSRNRFSHFLRLAMRHLSRDFPHMHTPVSKTLKACSDTDAPLVERFLRTELERSADPLVRGFLIRHIFEMAGGEKYARSMADLAIGEIVSGKLTEEQRSYLRRVLIQIGEPAAWVIEERIAHSPEFAVAELIALLDIICRERGVNEKTLDRIVRKLIQLLRSAPRNTRRRILETAIFSDPRISGKLRAEIASELLSLISEFEMPATREDIHFSLQRLGQPAIPAILHYLKRNFNRRESDPLFLTLGLIARETGGKLDDSLARESVDFCMEIFENKDNVRGKFCIALAGLCGYTTAGVQFVDKTVGILRKKVWKTKYTFDIIEALSILAGSPNIRRKHQREIFNLFSQIATMQTEATIGTERKGESGSVFEFGAGIHFDTIVIPAVIKGLERMFVSDRTTSRLRSDIVKRILVLWEGVSHMRLVWSPAAVEALVNAIGSAASSEHTASDIRVRLGRALLDFTNKTSVIRTLGRICSTRDKTPQMKELSEAAADALLKEWNAARDEDMERRVAILESLAALAANDSLNPDDNKVILMRETVIENLFQGLRSGIVQAADMLETLLQCRGLTAKQRAEIRTRLQSARGLTKTRGE